MREGGWQQTELEAHYRQAVQESLDTLLLPGLAPGGGPLRMSLRDDGCADLLTVALEAPETPADLSLDELRLLHRLETQGPDDTLELHLETLRAWRWSDWMQEAWSSPLEHIRAPEPPVQLFLGAPGVGKSTVLRKKAVDCAGQGARLEGPPPSLPLYLPLDAPAGLPRGKELETQVATYWEQQRPPRGLAPLFRQALEEGRALVLLDALDGLREPEARHQVEAWVERWRDHGNRFVLACGLVGHRAAQLPQSWPRCVLRGLPPSGVEKLARHAYEAWGSPRAPTEALAVVEELRRNPAALLLANSPAAVLKLLLLRRRLGSLPPHPAELLDAYVHQALEGHEGTRPQVAELALWMHQHAPRGAALRHELKPVLEGLGGRVRLEELLAGRSLLVEHGQGCIAFLLPALCEVLAAKALSQRPAEEQWRLLAPHLHDPSWRELLFHVVRRLATYSTGEASALIQRILSAGSELEQVLHRDLLLAVEVAAVAERGVSPGLVELLAVRVKALRQSPISQLRQDALSRLALLARRHQGPALVHLRDWLAQSGQGEEGELLSPDTPRPESPPPAAPLPPPWDVSREEVGSEAAREALLARLEDPDSRVREACLQALVARASGEARVRQVLLHHMERVTGAGSKPLATGLGAVASSSRELRNALLRRLDAPQAAVRRFMIQALAALAGSDSEVRRALLARMEDPDEWTQEEAGEALAGLAGSDSEVRRAMLQRLEKPSSKRVGNKTARALAGLAARHEEVRQALVAWLKPLPQDAWERWWVLGSLQPAAGLETVRQVLYASLESPQEMERQQAARSLQDEALLDEALCQRMKEWLDHPHPERRKAAVWVLAKRALGDEAVHRAVKERLEDAEGSVREAALSVLGHQAQSDEAVCRAVLRDLESPHASVLTGALHLAREAVAGCEPLRRAAVALLEHPHEDVRAAAVTGLHPLVAEDAELSGRMRRMLEDPCQKVRCACVVALASRLEREPSLARLLLPWLGADPAVFAWEESRRTLASQLARVAARDEALLKRVTAGLHASSWEERQGAALVLLHLPGGLPPSYEPPLRALLEDVGESEETSLSEQLSRKEVAAALLSAPEHALRERALSYILDVFARMEKPWSDPDLSLLHFELLLMLSSKWRPLYRDERVSQPLLRFLQDKAEAQDTSDEEGNPHLDLAYRTLLRLTSAPEAPRPTSSSC
jgi:hypothetical protein